LMPGLSRIRGTVRLVQDEIVAQEAGDRRFLDEATTLAALPYSCVLLSGGTHECGQYSMATWDPCMCLSAKGRKVTVLTGDGEQVLEDDPFSVLDEQLSSLQPDFPLQAAPFAGGAVGYLAYELKNHIERLPQGAVDDLCLPDLLMAFPRKVLVHDRDERTLRMLRLEYEGDGGGELPAPTVTGVAGRSTTAGKVRSTFTREEYCEAVGKIRRYIRNGDVYQVNLSQRFTFPFSGDPFELWIKLHDANPAPFYAWINGGDHRVLSTSMERFLRRRGDRVETRPIKGTRGRGATPGEDRDFRRNLLKDAKDDAELSMIVDLHRNDLSRVCLPRTVRVEEHRRIEQYSNVFHLVSVITGDLAPGTSSVDLLRATFPGGSITGCPRIRAMEIIDELEPVVRHVYTGAIGYLGLHRNIDLNVAIRTAVHQDGQCRFSAGGGVVHDSDEEGEYHETLQKARTMFEVLQAGEEYNLESEVKRTPR